MANYSTINSLRHFTDTKSHSRRRSQTIILRFEPLSLRVQWILYRDEETEGRVAVLSLIIPLNNSLSCAVVNLLPASLLNNNKSKRHIHCKLPADGDELEEWHRNSQGNNGLGVLFLSVCLSALLILNVAPEIFISHIIQWVQPAMRGNPQKKTIQRQCDRFGGQTIIVH